MLQVGQPKWDPQGASFPVLKRLHPGPDCLQADTMLVFTFFLGEGEGRGCLLQCSASDQSTEKVTKCLAKPVQNSFQRESMMSRIPASTQEAFNYKRSLAHYHGTEKLNISMHSKHSGTVVPLYPLPKPPIFYKGCDSMVQTNMSLLNTNNPNQVKKSVITHLVQDF